jgi:hypothetical protein
MGDHHDEEEKGKDNKAAASSSWQARRHLIVLAALGGTVAATAVVITVSVILRPVHVEFAVARATQQKIAIGSNDTGIYLNLTVTARSTTSRAMVQYRKVFVDLVAKTIQKDKNQLQIYRAPLQTPLPGNGTSYVPAAAATQRASIKASLLLVGDSLNTKSNLLASQLISTTPSINVVVTAQVSFKIGVVYTRVYDIAVRCSRVVFLPVNQPPPHPPPICTG